MTTEVFTLASDEPIEHAVWSFRANEISGAPVRDPAGNLVGVLSKSDLLDPLCHRTSSQDTVGDAMTPAVWAVHPDAPVMDAVELMVEKDIHRVLVVNGPGQLDGIVTAMSVLRALVGDGEFGPVSGRDALSPESAEPSSVKDEASVERRERIEKV